MFFTIYGISSVIAYSNNIYFGGSSSAPALDNNTSKGFVVKLDNNGNRIYYKKFEERRYASYEDNEYAGVSQLFIENKKLFVFGSVQDSLCLFNLTDTSTSVISAHIIHSLPYYIRHHKDTAKYFRNYYPDGSSASLSLYDFYINKYDTLGRICPDFILPVTNMTTTASKVKVWDAKYKMTPFKVTQKEVFITDTSFTGELTICSGEASSTTSSFIGVNKKVTDRAFIYPNPASSLLNIQFQSFKNQLVQIQIFTTAGKQVKLIRTTLLAGNNITSIPIADLKTGNYFLKFITKTEWGNFQFAKY